MLVSFITLLTICALVSLLALVPVEVKVEDYTDIAEMEMECSVLNEKLTAPQQQTIAA